MLTETDSTIVNNLAAECSQLTAAALQGLNNPTVAARLGAYTVPYVVVRLNPVHARVFAEAENGESIAVGDFKGPDVPKAFDGALVAFVTEALPRLTPKAQQHVSAHLRNGTGELAVVVTSFPVSVTLVLCAGGQCVPLVNLETPERVH